MISGLCLAAPPSPAAASGAQIVTVTLTTYATKLSADKLHAGDVKFIVKNAAADLVHEFFLVKTDLPQNRLPLEDDGKVDEESPLIQKVVAAEDIAPGRRDVVSVRLQPGHYVYFCNINAHHMIGMRGEFTIEPHLAAEP
jgi:uncharacterized cupredoxin-like copper-binding protein